MHVRSSTISAATCLAVLFAAVGADAQTRTSFKLREPSFLHSFRPVVESAHRSTVRIERFDKHDNDWKQASLGIVVDSSGLAVTKASEAVGTLRASLALHRHLDAVVIAVNSKYDLALIQLGREGQFAQSALEPIRWAKSAGEVGRWVVTAGTDRTPVAVGVISVAARVIAPSTEPAVLGITMGQDRTGRPTIEAANRNGAADQAGLLPGDVIYRVNDSDIRNGRALQSAILRRHPGDIVDIHIVRDGQKLQVRATLQHIPSQSEDATDQWEKFRSNMTSRWAMMNELGSRLSVRRDNFPQAAQHDTVLRPEDCGGPALNLDGEAIGINIARSGRTESLFIPADAARSVIDELMSTSQTRWTSYDRSE